MGLIQGTPGNDSIDQTTTGDDTVQAGSGIDTIYGSIGNDIIDGGDDWDQIWSYLPDARFGHLSGPRTITIGNNSISDNTGIINTHFSNIERIALITVNLPPLPAGQGYILDGSAFTGSGGVYFDVLGTTDTLVGSAQGDYFGVRGGRVDITGGNGGDSLQIGLIGQSAEHMVAYRNAAGDIVFSSNTGDLITSRGVETFELYNSRSTAKTVDWSGLDISITWRDIASGSTFANDRIIAGSGSDTFVFGLGNDTLTSGGGVDVFTMGSLWNVATGTSAAMDGDTIADFSALDRIDFSAVRYNNSFSASFIGSGAFTGVAGQVRYQISGATTLVQSDGNGDGIADATLTIANGAYELQETTAGSAILRIAGAQFNGSGADEELSGTDAPDIIRGLGGDDILHGLAGNDQLFGGEGSDVLDGGAGTDTLTGDGGDDTLYVEQSTFGAEAYFGGDGRDTLQMRGSIAPGQTGAYLLETAQIGSIERVVVGAEVATTRLARFSFSQIGAGLAPDTEFVGGDGRDIVQIISTGVASLTMPDFSFTHWGTQTLPANDRVMLFATDSFSHTLNARDGLGSIQSLTGGSAFDVLNGSDGVDFLNATAGADQLYGKGGDDLLVFAQSASIGPNNQLGYFTTTQFTGGVVDGGTGQDQLYIIGDVRLTNVTLHDIEGLGFEKPTLTTVVSGNLVTTTYPAHLRTDDTMLGDAPELTVTGPGILSVDVAHGAFDASGLTLTDGATLDLDLNGTAAEDSLIGAGGSVVNVLRGNGGNDRFEAYGASNALFGGADDDLLIAGGNAAYDGGDGDDTVDFSGLAEHGHADGVTVDLSQTGAQAIGPWSQTFVGIENVVGTDFADALIGSAGANRLYGGQGDDAFGSVATINNAVDAFYGGEGDDTAVFAGDLADYRIVRTGAGLDIVAKAAGAGRTHVEDIETLIFADQAIATKDVQTVADTLVGGLGGSAGYGEIEVPRNDDYFESYDISTVFEDGLLVGGARYASIFVNTNGNITFGSGLSDFTPSGITGNSRGIIAPFWADIDTRAATIPSAPIYVDLDVESDIVTVTWPGVNYYSMKGDRQNYFQLQLIDRGNSDFDIVFRYSDIEWANGARAGYNIASGSNAFELPQSGNDAQMLALDTTPGNTGQPGVWLFEVRNGVVHEPPVAQDDAYALQEDLVLVVPAAQGLLVNDSDPEGARLFAQLRSDAEHGTVTLADNGSFIYQPDADYHGTDSFTYSISHTLDGAGSVFATVTLSVASVADAPVAEGDSGFEVPHNQPLTIDPATLLANDHDPDGDPLEFVSVGEAQGGSVVLQDGDIVFTPENGHQGYAGFTYTIEDSTGLQSTGSVNLTVAPPNVQLSIEIDEEGLAPGETGVATLHYADISGTPLSATLVMVDGTGVLIKDPLSGQFSDRVLVFVGASPDGSTDLPLDIRMAGTSDTGASLSVSLPDPDATIDWAARKAALRPEGISEAAWDRIFANFTDAVGDTIGGLTDALAANTALLADHGMNGNSGAAALSFELEQAADFGSLTARATDGSLGLGWASVADLSLEVSDGGAVLHGLADFARIAAFDASASALYTLSQSVGRAVALNGAVTGASSVIEARFDKGIDGRFGATSASGLVLTKTAAGYTVADGSGNRMLFDADGTLRSVALIDGTAIAVTTDADGRVTGFAGPNDSALSITRASDGHVTSMVDGDGNAAVLTYAAGGAHLAQAAFDAGSVAFTYDAVGDLATIVAEDNPTVTIDYDAHGRLADIDVGGLLSQAITYTETGGYRVTDAGGAFVDITLLPGAVVGGLADAAGVSQSLRFDENGRLTGIANSDGTATGLTFDAMGRVTGVTDANGAIIHYGYDGDDTRPASFTDANGETKHFVYGADGKLASVEWPDGTELSFAYDDEGNLVSRLNRAGSTISYDYDAAGRLVAVSDSSAGPLTYGYDAQGHLTEITGNAGTTALAYDADDHVTLIAYPNGRSLAYTYDDAGRRMSMTDQDGHVQTYAYDAAGRLASVGDGTATLVAYGYDASGNLAHEANGSGTSTDYSYDSAGRLIDIVNKAPDGSISSFNHYAYDAAGQRVGMTTQDGAWTYGYDANGQLTSADFSSTNPAIADKSLAYVYDAAGNRLSATENGVTTLYTVGTMNQYSSVGEASFTYDANGNMVTRTDASGTTHYSYDDINRLTGVTGSGGSVTSYEYDAFGNRSAVIENGVRTEFLVDPFGLGDVVGEYSASGLVATYAHGLGLASALTSENQRIYFHADAVGSVNTITGDNGVLLNKYAYNPFGGEIFESENTQNHFEFNGQFGVMEDNIGLSYMRFRMYDDTIGRFTSEDPIFMNGDPENLYRFSGSDPVTLIDPLGKDWGVFSLTIGASVFVHAGFSANAGVYVDFENGSAGLTASSYYIPIGEEGGIDVSGGVQLTWQKQVNLPPSAEFNDGFILKGGGTIDVKTRELNSVTAGVPFLSGGVGAHFAKPGWSHDASFSQIWDDYKWLGQTIWDKIFPHSSIPTQDVITPVPSPASPSSRSDGDPHLTTFDGLNYDFQAVGEFVLVRGDGFEIQTRQEAIGPSSIGATASVNTATVMKIGDDVVGIYAKQDDHLVINGEAVSLSAGESVSVGDGGSVYFVRGDGVSQALYVVTDALGDGFWVYVYGRTNHLRPFIAADATHVEGLLGNHDGNPANDIALDDGTVIAQPVAAQVLYGAFADSWRVTDATSLFVYSEGQTTETFTDRSFPSQVVTVADLTPEQLAKGIAAATAAGLEPGTIEFDNAVLDVGLTGDDSFAQGIAATPDLPQEQVPLVIQRPPEILGETVATDEDTAILIDVLANDSDPEGDELLLTHAVDDEGGLVEIVGGQVRYTPKQDFNGQAHITYTVADGAGNTVDAVATVDVAPVNDAPDHITLSVTSVSEDTAQWTTLGQFSANDVEGDTLTYSLLDADGGPFSLRGRRLISNEHFDFESRQGYDILVAVSDGAATVQKSFHIDVRDVFEPPANQAPVDLFYSRTSVRENTAIGTSLGQLHATDPEGGTLRWTLLDDAHGTFRVVGDKIRVVGAIDYETTPQLSFIAQVQDSAGNAVQQTFTLDVIDVTEMAGLEIPLL